MAERHGDMGNMPAPILNIHEVSSTGLQRSDAASASSQRSEAGQGCCYTLWGSMQRCPTTAQRQWERRRGKFKPTPKYIFIYGVLPLGLLLYTFVQLSDIFIDYSYYSDVHVPCSNLTKPFNRIRDQLTAKNARNNQPHWQKVVQNETYVLSANLDSRSALGGRLQVRIIGISDTYKYNYPPTDYCQFWYGDSIIMDSVRVRRFVIQENHDLRYGSIIYNCVLPDPKRIPQFVSITRNRCTLPPNILYIEHSNHSNVPSKQPLYNFTICVAPFVHGFGNTKQLIEFMEVSSALGADNVIFYNYTSDPRVRDVLNYYTDSGRAELLQWKMPVRCGEESDPTTEIHYYGQVLALNDCFYRNLYKSRYTVVMDLDEFIVPHRFRSWAEAMSSFPEKLLVIDYGAYIFRNSFFINEGPGLIASENISDRKPAKGNEKLIRTPSEDIPLSLRNIFREGKIYPAYIRSKYIVDNKKGIALGIHYPFQYIESTTYEYIVLPQDGLLHHYRQLMFRNTSYPSSFYLKDDHMAAFKERILKNFERTNDKLGFVTE